MILRSPAPKKPHSARRIAGVLAAPDRACRRRLSVRRQYITNERGAGPRHQQPGLAGSRERTGIHACLRNDQIPGRHAIGPG
jgi:hypothetical protein